jgi:hypothetical protein
MAITNVMGFDDVVPRTDTDLLSIEGFPFKWTGNGNLTVFNDEVLGRHVLRTINTGWIDLGHLSALASDVFHQWKEMRTKWFIGCRFRSETIINSNNMDGSQTVLLFTRTDSMYSTHVSAFTPDELTYYTTTDRYVYLEVCLNWEENVIERWVDGYKLGNIDLPTSMVESEDFHIMFTVFSPSGTNSNRATRWTDFYFMVDTSNVDNGTTPSQRLGGSFVRSVGVGNVVLTEGWGKTVESPPSNILNTDMERSTGSRLYPHLSTSIAENASLFYYAVPSTGEAHRLGRGNIQFLQMLLNAHRYDGSTAQLYATPIDLTGNEGDEVSLTMFVDDFNGRPIAHFNNPLTGGEWTPSLVASHGLEIYSRSGGV